MEEAPSAEKTEAQKVIEAKLRKHEEEDAERLRELEEQRRVEREKADEELRRLKEKQACDFWSWNPKLAANESFVF